MKAEPSWNGVMDAFARQRSAQVVDPRDLHAAGRWLDGVDREAGERRPASVSTSTVNSSVVDGASQ